MNGSLSKYISKLFVQQLTIGIAKAGIIEIDGVLYRPAQNNRYTYGDSIIINKINRLNDFKYSEEFYMSRSVNKKIKTNQGMHGMHTINVVDDIVVIDGTKWRFSPVTKLKMIFLKLLSWNFHFLIQPAKPPVI